MYSKQNAKQILFKDIYLNFEMIVHVTSNAVNIVMIFRNEKVGRKTLRN